MDKIYTLNFPEVIQHNLYECSIKYKHYKKYNEYYYYIIWHNYDEWLDKFLLENDTAIKNLITVKYAQLDTPNKYWYRLGTNYNAQIDKEWLVPKDVFNKYFIELTEESINIIKTLYS